MSFTNSPVTIVNYYDLVGRLQRGAILFRLDRKYIIRANNRRLPVKPAIAKRAIAESAVVESGEAGRYVYNENRIA